MAKNLFELTATEAVEMLSQKKIQALDLVIDCLERISSLDKSIEAWTSLDPDAVIAAAKRADEKPSTQPLTGIPIGLKDNIETIDFPTTYGSAIYKGHFPAQDAVCVTLCKEAGTIIMGKTASTEFAYRTPSNCKNPHNLAHSPGGSSSGSAAAVAAQMVPLAIGTQTAGSVIRPAAYCGVYALKPRYGDLSFAGVKNLAHSFDTLGCMARSLEDLSLFYCALQKTPNQKIDTSLIDAPKIAIYRTAFWDQAQPAAVESFEKMLTTLSANKAQLHEVRLDSLDKEMLTASWTINKFEGSRYFLQDALTSPELMSEAARALVQEGLEISFDHYQAARAVFERARSLISATLAEFDGVVSLSSPGEAPVGLQDTGPVTFNFICTSTYLPALNIPFFTGPSGLPMGMQVVGTGTHHQLLEMGSWIEKQLQK
jgi:Asp-tRNA(Asn)/Glu-tRNA(Gln) amidotransferase A subunit family amidase